MALRRDYMQNKWKINLAYHIFEHKGAPHSSLLESLAIICWSWLLVGHESLLLTSFPIFISNDTLVAWNHPLWEHLPHGNQQFVFHCWKLIVKHLLAHHCLISIHSFETVAIFSWEYSLLPVKVPRSLLFFIREETSIRLQGQLDPGAVWYTWLISFRCLGFQLSKSNQNSTWILIFFFFSKPSSEFS